MQSRIGLAVLILAAGIGRRLGSDKATLPWGSTSLLQHVLNQFPPTLTARRVVILNPNNLPQARSQLSEDNELMVNPVVGADMLSSVRIGISQLRAFTGPICVHPIDVFGVTPDLVNVLYNAWQIRPDCIHLPEVSGRGGHPLVIPPTLISLIESIPPNHGLNWLLKTHPECVIRHTWPDERILLDIDTPKDYERYRPDHN